MSARSQRRARRAPRHVRTSQIVLAIASILAIAVIAIVAIVNRNTVESSMIEPFPSGLAVGAVAPNFSVTTNHGAFSLSTANGPVLLEIFAAWCPHCQRETAVLNRLYATYGDRIHFVAVTGSSLAMDHASPESQQDVDAFVDLFQVQYPVAFDPSMSVAKTYFQNGFPTITLIGSDKRVRYIESGEVTAHALEGVIQRALAGSR